MPAYDRYAVQADLIARRLWDDLLADKVAVVGGETIEEACDAARAAMIGYIDRERLIDQTTRRFVELLADPPT